MRRVLITAGATPIAGSIAESVLAQPDVEAVVLVDEHAPDPVPAAEVSVAGKGYVDLRDVIDDGRIDTVIHAGLAPDRTGARPRTNRADVITTMHIAAVAADVDGPVRTLVAISSNALYPVHSGAPAFQPENGPRNRPRPRGYAASLAEAEDYLVALAEQRPNLSICVLRFADLIGPGVTGPLASMLEGRWSPRLVGYDPMIQLLHVEDAVHAVEHAMEHDLAGTFNVASPGVLPWSQVVRLAGNRAVWGVPVGAKPLAGALRALGAPPVSPGMIRVLQFGRGVATERLEATGWEPAHSLTEAVGSLRA